MAEVAVAGGAHDAIMFRENSHQRFTQGEVAPLLLGGCEQAQGKGFHGGVFLATLAVALPDNRLQCIFLLVFPHPLEALGLVALSPHLLTPVVVGLRSCRRAI